MDERPIEIGAGPSPTPDPVVSLGRRRGPGVFIVAALVVVVALAVAIGTHRSSDRAAPATTTTPTSTVPTTTIRQITTSPVTTAEPRATIAQPTTTLFPERMPPCALHIAMPAPGSDAALAAQVRPDRGIIVETDNGARLRVFHLDTGAETDVSVPVADYPERPFVTGGAVVYLSDGNAYALASPYQGPPTPLGAAVHTFASTKAGFAWIIVNTPTGLAAQMVEVTGRSTTAQIPLPDGLTPLTQMVGGLVVQARDGTLQLFDPDEQKVLCTIGAAEPPADNWVVLATHDSLIAWRACYTTRICFVHLTDVSAGTDRVVTPPAGSTEFYAGGALSPKGTTLAAFVDQATPSGPRAAVVLVDTTTGVVTPVANSVIEIGETIGAAAWSPTTQWLYFCGLNAPMKAYRHTNPAAIELTVPSSYTFAAD